MFFKAVGLIHIVGMDFNPSTKKKKIEPIDGLTEYLRTDLCFQKNDCRVEWLKTLVSLAKEPLVSITKGL